MRKHIGILLAFVCIAMLASTAHAKSNSSNLNRERLEVGRLLLEVTAEQVPDVLPYYTYDIEYHDPIVDIYGIEDMSEFLFRLFGATPDLVTVVEDEIAIDDMYTATWTMYGAFAGVPYEVNGMSIIKFRPKSTDVYYQYDYYSESDIMQNIPGLDEAVGGFRTFYRCAVDPTFDCPL